MTSLKVWTACFCAIAIGAAAGCGPSGGGNTRKVLFYLATTASVLTDITHLKFVATPTSGNLVGSDGGCEWGSSTNADSNDTTPVDQETGELTVDVTVAAADALGPGDVVVICQVEDDGADPDFMLSTNECTSLSTTNPVLNTDCRMAFRLSTVPAPPVCGNGVIEEGEECDNGSDNSKSAACVTNCKENYCGDGNQCTKADCETDAADGKEDCDKGTENTDTGPAGTCATDCTVN